ncbi:HPF/RaiA family ribosome-associated protein [Qipengyuania sp. DSG2-2]|uniref:HPF/RaiA family ribosome-associated protein n=1 Tax=Qipengyuania sp. DGS2-2 TaxID=3349631 RepID=UPI0036D32615
MQIQFNSDSSVMGTENVAERIENQLRTRLGRFEDRLTRLEVHVRDENGAKGGADDKVCMLEARVRGGSPVSVTAKAGDVDAAARSAGTKLAKLLDRHFGKASRPAPKPDPVE